MTPDHGFVDAVRTGLAEFADPVKAPQMRAYMKSDQPFRGVPKPIRAALVKKLVAGQPIAERQVWLGTVLTLWREAEFREERYVALDLCADRRWQAPDLLPIYRELIVTGAWWDFVDEIASRRIGPLLRSHPAEVRPVVTEWITAEDRWLRRTSIICQLGSKAATDADLLAEAIEANLNDGDFFLRKGIGWALREYAKTEPGWVRTFTHTHPGLSPLSRREALKHLSD